MKTNRFFKGVIGSLSLCAIPSLVLAGQYSSTYTFETPYAEYLPNGQQLIVMEDTWQDSVKIGAPILPAKFSKILIPANESIVSIDIKAGEEITLPGTYQVAHAIKPVPYSFTGPRTPTEQDGVIYSADKFYPYNESVPSNLRHIKGATFQKTEINPVKYNPVTGEVIYYSSITVTVNTQENLSAPSNEDQLLANFRNIAADNKAIAIIIDNEEDLFADMQPAAVIDGARQFLVVTTPELVDVFTKLTDYRSSYQGGGYTTHIETIDNIENNYEGVDRAEKLRNYIKDSYNNYGTQFVVLGGDADGTMEEQMIPTRGAYANVDSNNIEENIPTDLYYACLDGSWNADGDEKWGEKKDGIGGNNDIDWEPEVYVGRIAADNAAEANNHIDKIIAFETAESRPSKALLVGEKLDDDFWQDGSNVKAWGGRFLTKVEEGFSSEITLDWLTDFDLNQEGDAGYPNNKWYKEDLISKINSNEYFMINHNGHSSNTYNMRLQVTSTLDDLADFSNSSFFLAYSEGCYASSFDNRLPNGSYTMIDSMGESLTNRYGNSGAFAAIGNSRYGWYNSTPYRNSSGFHKAFVNSIYHAGNSKIGKALQDSKIDMDYTSELLRWISFETNLIGDPASLITDFIEVGGCDAITATLAEHETAGRAVKKYGILYYAVGSNQYLGSQATTSVSLSQDDLGNWVKGECSSSNSAPQIDGMSAFAEGPHLTVTGSATDTNGDLTKVELQLNNSGNWISASGLNNWIHSFHNMQPGNHTIKARAIDSKGAVSAINELQINFQTPAAPVIENASAIVSEQYFEINGSVSDVNNDVAFVKIINDELGEFACKGTQEFRCGGFNLEKNRAYTFYVTAKDLQGNISNTFGPIEIVMPADHPPTLDSYSVDVTGGNITITGTSSDIDGDIRETVFLIGGAGILCSGKENWTCSFEGAPVGIWPAKLKTVDSYNNTSNIEEFTITVEDNESIPVIESYNWSQNGNSVTVTGTASDADGDLAEITIQGASGNVNCSGTESFTCTVSDIAPGTYNFALVAIDAAGNSSEPAGSFIFTVEEAGECITATNYLHIQEGRAYAGGLMNMYAYANGTDDDLGLAGSAYYSATTSLEEISAGVWAKVSSCN